MDRWIARVLALAAVAILLVAALGDRQLRRGLVVAGRRAATAVGWYHATMPFTIEPRCASVAVNAWGQSWIGATPSALVTRDERASTVQDVGVLTRTGYGSATFTDGGGLSVALRRMGPRPSPDPTCSGPQT